MQGNGLAGRLQEMYGEPAVRFDSGVSVNEQRTAECTALRLARAKFTACPKLP
jgi:hypothetical protein